jgi:hypothetical protein
MKTSKSSEYQALLYEPLGNLKILRQNIFDFTVGNYSDVSIYMQ